MGSQHPPSRRDRRPLSERRNEAAERTRQWIADGEAARANGNELWAAECAARAMVWVTELEAIDAMLTQEALEPCRITYL